MENAAELKKEMLLNCIKELISKHIPVNDVKSILNYTFKELGLQSMAIVGIFLELEMKEMIDISKIDNDSPPNSIYDILKLAEESYEN